MDSPSLAKSDAVGAAIKFVAIGSYDGKVRLLSQFSWKLAFTLPLIHPKDMEAGLRPPSFGGKGQAEGAEGESLDGSSVLDPQYGSAIGEGSLLLVVEIPGTRVQASHLAQAAMSAHRSTASSVATSSIADSTVVGSVMTLGRDDNFRIVAAGGLEAHDADDAAGAADPTLRHARAGKLRTKLRRSIAAAPLSGSAASGISKVTNNLPLTEKSLSLIANNPQLDDSFSRGIEGDTSNIDDEDDNDDTCFAPQNLSELPSTSAAGKTTAQRGTTAGSDPLTSRSKQTGPTSSAPMGVSWVSFSSDNQVLAAREDRYPRCLWLWQPHKAQLISILVMMENVSCAQWNNSCRHQHHEQQCSDGIGSEEENVASSNTVGASSEYQHGIDDSASADYEGPILAFCTGTSRVYFWTSKWGPVYAPVPKLAASQSSHRSAPRGAKAAPGSGSGKFSVTRLQWSSTVRNRLILSGKESHCVCDVQFDSLSIRRKAKMKLSGGK